MKKVIYQILVGICIFIFTVFIDFVLKTVRFHNGSIHKGFITELEPIVLTRDTINLHFSVVNYTNQKISGLRFSIPQELEVIEVYSTQPNGITKKENNHSNEKSVFEISDIYEKSDNYIAITGVLRNINRILDITFLNATELGFKEADSFYDQLKSESVKKNIWASLMSGIIVGSLYIVFSIYLSAKIKSANERMKVLLQDVEWSKEEMAAIKREVASKNEQLNQIREALKEVETKARARHAKIRIYFLRRIKDYNTERNFYRGLVKCLFKEKISKISSREIDYYITKELKAFHAIQDNDKEYDSVLSIYSQIIDSQENNEKNDG